MPQNISIRGTVWFSRYIREVGEKREEKEQAVKSFHWHVRKYRRPCWGGKATLFILVGRAPSWVAFFSHVVLCSGFPSPSDRFAFSLTIHWVCRSLFFLKAPSTFHGFFISFILLKVSFKRPVKAVSFIGKKERFTEAS